MEKRIIKYLLAALLVIPFTAFSQSGAEFVVGGHYSRPMSLTRPTHFGVEDGSGLFANPGGGFMLEVNSRRMMGLGGILSASFFGMDQAALANHLGAERISWSGGINSTQIGLGPVFNLELIEQRVFFQLKSYLGIRFIGTPDFTLSYSPLDNRYTTMEYRTDAHAASFYQFDGGFQFFPSENVGIVLGIGYLGGSVNSIDYRYRGDGSKQIEGWDEINQSIHYLNYRLGLVLK